MDKKIFKELVPVLIFAGIQLCGVIFYDYMGKLAVWQGLEVTITYFTVLLMAYMHGTGKGGVTGAIVGAIMLIKSADMTFVGMFCMLGIMTGFFNRLGKLASLMAYFLCLWILALLYVPVILEPTYIIGIMLAGMIFMILPIKRKIADKEVLAYSDFEESVKTSRRRIVEMAETFRRLAGSVISVNRENDIVFATGVQLKEAAGVLDKISETMVFEYNSRHSREEEQVWEALGKKGYCVKSVRIYKGIKDEFNIEVAFCNDRITATVKEAAKIISTALGKKIKAADGCGRTIVNREMASYTFVEAPEFMMLYAAETKTKSGEEVSGDNFTCTEFGSGEILLGIVDGMGSGAVAGEESELVIELLEELLKAGFTDEAALLLINSMLITRSEERSLAAIDMAVGDLYTGRFNFVKLGAAATFIKRNRWVEILKSTNYPVGILKSVDYENTVKKLYDGDYIIMVSDGVLDAIKGDDKEEILSGWIADYNKKNPKDFARYILDKVVEESGEIIKDDMTVLVAGIWAKKA